VSRASATAVAAVVATVAIAGCAGPGPRFADRSILWRDPDDAPVPMPPDRRDPGTTRLWPGANNGVFRPADRFFTADYGLEAVNVNALDEVPDSSWFSDPRRDPADPSRPPRALSFEDMERGAGGDTPARPPFRILRTLSGGSADGFVAVDALDRRYALKLDPEDHAGLVTGTDLVTRRLAWASGWRVPADELLEVRRSDLTVGTGATMNDGWGRRIPLDGGDVDAILWHAAHSADGRYRVVASRWVEGHVLGALSWLGRDRADLNDRYDHQDRRDLRGFGTFAAWIDDVDTIDLNTLDTYVGAAGRGHVVHYQLDLGGSFGVFAAAPKQYWMSDQSYFQFDRLFGSLAGLGVVPHRWEGRAWQRRREQLVALYPELGGFSDEHFAPRKWRPIVDTPPFVRQTDRDRYWGAKRVAAFSFEELRGAIAAARYRPVAADYLARVLWSRREAIARDAFSRTGPLDHFRTEADRLCFTDWWVRAGLGGGDATDYRARENGADIDRARGAERDGAACVYLPRGSGYRIIELSAQRPGERRSGRRVAVHLIARDGETHIVGVLR
jgi:hypothetical protein